MNKLIVKTALITLGCVMLFCVLLYGVFALFFPVLLAGFLEDLGREDLAVPYYELEYERTNDPSSLVVLCLRIDQSEDSVRANKYLTALTERDDFMDICNALTSETDKNSISYYEFFYGKLVIACQKTLGVEKATERALLGVSNGYKNSNPFYISLSVDGLYSVSDLEYLNATLNSIKGSLNETEKTYLERDVEIINYILSEKQA